MKAFIVYCHPSEESFTSHVRDAFIKGIVDSGNEYVLSDLYQMDFKTDMSEKEYLRDSNYSTEPCLEADVLAEQAKINAADAIIFIYPVFWTEAPAKLIGWFDRVFTYGFAYGPKTMKVLEKGLILCTAGNTTDKLEQFGLLPSMKKIMFGDRLFNRVRHTDFVVFGGMTRACPSRRDNWDENLATAYNRGLTLFSSTEVEFSLDGRHFMAINNSDSGEVSIQTVFCYHQKDKTVWAEYSGGDIIKGFLVGKIDTDNELQFTYQHINTNGELKTGSCHSVPRTENGKLRFYESWQWTSGPTGTSIIEEI